MTGLVKGRTKPPGKKPITDAIKLKIIEKTVKERPAHADHAGFRTRLADALGTASPDFVDASLHQLVQAVSRCDCPEGGSEMELVLGPMREAKGEPNWRPIRWMEGLAFQAQVGKSLRERFELSQHHGQK